MQRRLLCFLNIMPKIHYFNPGHETAILLGKANYTPPTNVQRMHKELACLPVWYAEPDDYVWVPEITSPRFFSLQPKELHPFATVVTRKTLADKVDSLSSLEAAPWGISLPSLHLFNRLKDDSRVQIHIPEWKDDFVRLTGRATAAACLDKIRGLLPDLPIPVAPKFCTKIHDIEKYLILQNAPFVLKTPYSSSGRGLLWIEKRRLSEKDKNWIQGALAKQGTVSIECGLEKVQDFAMEFYSDGVGNLRYEGLSVFGTERGGAYHGNVLQAQSEMRAILTQWIDEETLSRVQQAVEQVLQETFGSLYTGYLGVDMLVYRDKNGNYALHPCVEINMRYTMGMVALRIFEKYLAPKAIGDFRITYESKAGEAYEQHRFMKKVYPLKLKEGKIEEGYLSLCPVTKETGYRAYILVM